MGFFFFFLENDVKLYKFILRNVEVNGTHIVGALCDITKAA